MKGGFTSLLTHR